MRKMLRKAALALLAVATLVVFMAIGVVFSSACAENELELTEAAAAEQPLIVYDTPAEAAVPLWLQTDERWAGYPYAEVDKTIETNGCGLVAASMAMSYLSGEYWMPDRVLRSVGNACTVDSQNDMTAFCAWMQSLDGSLDYSVIYDDQTRAMQESAEGRMVFASLTGQITDYGTDYGGHIVLISGTDEEHVYIHDPHDGEVIVTKGQFRNVNWAYFISIGRSS